MGRSSELPRVERAQNVKAPIVQTFPKAPCPEIVCTLAPKYQCRDYFKAKVYTIWVHGSLGFMRQRRPNFLVSRIDRFRNAKGRMIIDGDDRNEIAGEMWIAEFERCVQKQRWAGACYEAIGGYVPVCCHRSEIIESTRLCAEWDDFNIHGEASHMAAGFAFALAGLLNAYSFVRVYKCCFSILLMDNSCMTLRTLNYGNYGIFLIMGNAGFCPSAVSRATWDTCERSFKAFCRIRQGYLSVPARVSSR